MSDRVPSNSSSAIRKRGFGLAWAWAALSAAVVIAWLVDATATTHLAGVSAWGVSALAAGVCWFGAMLSLSLLHLLRLRGSPMAGALLGMLVRMTIPLAIGGMAAMRGGSLAEAGLFGQLVIFYLFTLAIETCLAITLMKSTPPAASNGNPVSEGSATHGL